MMSAKMSEDALLSTTLALCQLLRLNAAHFRPARTDRGWRTPVAGMGRGFPDFVIVGPGGVLWRELKTATGRLSQEQRRWLDRLTEAGCDADVWRPADLTSGRIPAELQAIAAAHGRSADSTTRQETP